MVIFHPNIYLTVRAMKIITSLFFPALFLLACSDKPDIQPQNNQIAVYPNPVVEMAYISFENPDNGPYTLVVFDTKGQIFFEKNEALPQPQYQVNLSGEPKGIYHIILEKGNTTLIRRLVKMQ